MENEKNFKQLLQSAFESASPDFTRVVMEGIKANAAEGSISNRWKKIYRMTFVIVAVLSVALSFLSKPAQQVFDKYVNIPLIDPQIIFWSVIYIFSFWMLIIFSFRLDKRKAFHG